MIVKDLLDVLGAAEPSREVVIYVVPEVCAAYKRDIERIEMTKKEILLVIDGF